MQTNTVHTAYLFFHMTDQSNKSLTINSIITSNQMLIPSGKKHLLTVFCTHYSPVTPETLCSADEKISQRQNKSPVTSL